MIKKLDLYIWKEMTVPILIGTVSFLMMFQINLVIALFKDYQMDHVPLAALAQLILFKTPFFLQMTLPIGVAIASSLTMARIARESELTAMRTAGVAIRRVVRPIMLVGLAIAALNFYVVEYVMPRSEVRARQLGEEVFMLSQVATPRSNVTQKIGDYTVNVGTVIPQGRNIMRLDDVLLIQRTATNDIVLISTPRGMYVDGEWRFETPYMRVVRGLSLVSGRSMEDLLIKEKISIEEFATGQPRQDEKSILDLWKMIQQGRRIKNDTRILEVAFHNRFAVPITCLIFSITGPMTALWFARTGPFIGVFLSLVMVMLYYNGFVIFNDILGRNGIIPPMIAAWAPNLLFAAIGLWALRRAE